MTAFEYYLQACQILADDSPASFRNTFDKMRTKYLDMNLGVQTLVNNLIQEKFSNISDASLLTALKDLYIDEFGDVDAL